MDGKCRVLIISNECLSNSSSNGRTLRNFLLGWPKDKLAQFYVKPSIPDCDVCSNYYHISDKQALKYFLNLKKENINKKNVNLLTKEELQKEDFSGSNPKKRNAITMYIRDVIWQSNQWMKSGFLKWVEDFDPELILLQAGDNGFMLKLARQLSQRYNVPLVIYNSENYYFKKYDYFRADGIAHYIYPLFRRHFHKQFDIAMKQASKSIYICEMLQKDYDDVFSLPSETIYTATEMKQRNNQDSSTGFVVSYLGNFGVGRHEPLIEIADILHSLDSNCYLDIYGKISDDSIKTAFEACPGIRYKGFVSYEECVRIMQESDLLVHAENFSPFFREGLKRAFSTKLSDSLASGTCFLLYAPKEIACTQYLLQNKAAYVASTRRELEEILRTLYSDASKRWVYTKKALKLVEKNHMPDVNAKRFQEILQEEYTKARG